MKAVERAQRVHHNLGIHLKLSDECGVAFVDLVELVPLNGVTPVLVLEGERMPSGLPSKFSKKSR